MSIPAILTLIVGCLALIVLTVYLMFNQKEKIIEWLKWAVAEAEKLLGSGTGQLKLRQVYDWFCTKFPVAAIFLPFKIFSTWVDIALETFDDWLSNTYFVDYINYSGGKTHNGNVHK